MLDVLPRPVVAQAALKSAGQAIGALGDSASALSGGDEKASAAARLAALQRLQAAQAAAQSSLPGAPSWLPAHHVLQLSSCASSATPYTSPSWHKAAIWLPQLTLRLHLFIHCSSCTPAPSCCVSCSLQPLFLRRACDVFQTPQVLRSCWSDVLLLWSITAYIV